MSEHTHANPKRELASYGVTLVVLLILTIITVAVSYTHLTLPTNREV